ncbi:DNA cytosine methyltransferase [Ferruginibacter sp.]|uniref:DNA cytosine methyltransferase n=1 Tax=Ferruginibacter sp. TaxID=1940288 RepID=UPI0019AC0D9B|nr:DNA (cytosine-5-)-methyltransferase [Ferruginibacter sp.]MBC7628098.1 DNA (cytosine-5-)-methyltransferase [Ferruginibacter sp.]
MIKKLNFIDLFAGAGGLSEGFIRAGFNPIAHVEMDEAACYTLKTRTAYHYLKGKKKFDEYVKYLKGEINRATLYSSVPEEEMNSVINLALSDENNPAIFKRIDKLLQKQPVDLIIGGPPCQAYSLVGRARSANGMETDPRNHLYLQYAKFLKKYKPKMFVFENVLGLRSADGGGYFKKMVKEFDKKGYGVKDFLFNACDFGVLQNRKRIVLVGYRKDLNITVPGIEPVFDKQFKVQSIFQDLPKLQAGQGKDKGDKYASDKNDYLDSAHIRNGIDVLTQHVSRPHTDQDKEIYRIAVDLMKQGDRLNYINLPEKLKTHKNRHSFFDRFKVVNAEAVAAQTVVAHIAKDGHYYIHPDKKQNRSISVREAARLQSFPDDFYFEGVKEGRNRTAAFKQIGNAVPPLMAQSMAKVIKDIF